MATLSKLSKIELLHKLLDDKDTVTLSYSIDTKVQFIMDSLVDVDFDFAGDDKLVIDHYFEIPVEERLIKEVVCGVATIDFINQDGYRVIAKIIGEVW